MKNSQTAAQVRISVIVPTFNRSDQISPLIASILNAKEKIAETIELLIVDNNSNAKHKRRYKQIIESLETDVKVVLLTEEKQGRSCALNRGVKEASGEFIAFIDDDETASEGWLHTIQEWTQREEQPIDYVVGPCLPDWESPPPLWLPALSHQYRGLLGWIEQSNKIESFDSFDGELCGGNCLIRKSALVRAGLFNENLGRRDKNLMGGEDGALHRRLKELQMRGMYDPKMIIYHKVPTSRMTYSYHLRWSFWSGVSNYIRVRDDPTQAEPVPFAFEIPRYWIRKGLQGLANSSLLFLTFRMRNNPRFVIGLLDFAYLCGLLSARFHR